MQQTSSVPKALVLLLLLLAVQSAAFKHGWDTVQDLMFGWIGDGSDDTPLSQLEWMADNYGLVVVSNAGHGKPYNMSWPGQFEQARLLKARNPDIKTLLYAQSHTGPLGFGQQEVQMHPEWWLRDLSGAPFMQPLGKAKPPAKPQQIDYRRPDVRAHFANTLSQFGARGQELFDGMLTDSSAAILRLNQTGHVPLTTAAMRDITLAKMQMLNETAHAIHRHCQDGATPRECEVIANPTLVYGVIGDEARAKREGFLFPTTYHWQFVDGTLDEMFGAFGTQMKNGSWNATRMTASFEAIINQSAGGRGKTVLIHTNPGPCNVPFMKVNITPPPKPGHGPKQLFVPTWPVSWAEKMPTTTRGLQTASIEMLHQSLAPYLIVAEQNVWLGYAWFYSVQTGWAPCPDAPGTCAAPPLWYPDLAKPLGEPLGPAQRNGTVWTRRFAHASVYVDLADRTASRVTFHSSAQRDETDHPVTT